MVYDLVKKSGVKADFHFNVTSVDPPELLRFIRKNFNDVTWHRPEKTMWKLIREKMMPPTRKIRYCCEHLKERGGKGRKIVVTGVRGAESSKRAGRKMIEACQRVKRHYLNPIIDWEDQHVWQYIRENNLPYCELYDQGFTRIGCVGCPMGTISNRRKELSRWPKYEKLYRAAFVDAVKNKMERLRKGDKYLINTSGYYTWDNGDGMFDWWMGTQREKENPDQGVLFE